MRAIAAVVFAIWSTWLFTEPAFAEKRVALVIGNSAYRNVAKLSNPANDAAAVAAMFKSAGFDFVVSKSNLSVNEMRKALRDFGNKSRDADMAVVYYAGHGIELDGTNYLIPVDATLETDADVLDEALALDRVLFAVEPAKQLRLVILDACRDNPFAKTMKRTIASRAVGRGLAKIEPTGPNTMIAFAAKAGSTASDGDGKNSPFATALVTYLPKPGLDLRRAFGFVRDDVLKNTGNKQEPYVYGSLGGDDVPLVPTKPVAIGPRADPQSAVRRDYELALQLGTRDGWEAFVSQYPDGFYANLAKGQLKKISAEETRVSAVEKARLAEQEKARLAAEKAAQEKKQQLAAVTPADKPEPPAVDLPRALQAELRRVGCNTGTVDGNWNAASQKALDLFNKHAGMKLDVKVANIDALDAVKGKANRVCPLICEHGFKADRDRCSKITCRAGYEVGDDNSCEKIQVRKPTAKREEPNAKQERANRAKLYAAPTKPQASGQIVCGAGGCRPVARGCRLGAKPNPLTNQGNIVGEICD